MSQKNDGGMVLRGTVVVRGCLESLDGDVVRHSVSMIISWPGGGAEVVATGDGPAPAFTVELGEAVEVPVQAGAKVSIFERKSPETPVPRVRGGLSGTAEAAI